MKIVIVAATEEEIAPSIQFMENQAIEYLITGVGMLSSTYAITKRAQAGKVDLFIQVGIGGILNSEATLGEVYRIVEDEIFELGAEDGADFLPIETLGFGKSRFTEIIPSFLSKPPILKHARGITVNKVHGSSQSLVKLRKRYQEPLIESMEGVSVFYVARQEKIAALQFRAVSNYIEPRNRAGWKINEAVKNLNIFLQNFLAGIFHNVS